MVAASGDESSNATYPWWAHQIRAEIRDPWYWMAWGIANENAAEAWRIYNEMPMDEIATFYAIDAYHNSVEFD